MITSHGRTNVSLFITFEGGEGCGKSYQSGKLYQWLSGEGYEVILTYEPGGTELGNELRRLLKKKSVEDIGPLVELLLFNASRAQLVAEVIRPALKEGKIVICDRFADSTTVYQGYGRGLDMDTVTRINTIAMQEVRPDLTIFLDLLPNTGLRRKSASADDRFEQEEPAFHERVRDGFLDLARKEQGRWLVIDGSLSKAEIARRIRVRVESLIAERR